MRPQTLDSLQKLANHIDRVRAALLIVDTYRTEAREGLEWELGRARDALVMMLTREGEPALLVASFEQMAAPLTTEDFREAALMLLSRGLRTRERDAWPSTPHPHLGYPPP